MVKVEFISRLCEKTPDHPLGNDMVPVPTNTIFVVPVNVPELSDVELIDSALIVPPLNVDVPDEVVYTKLLVFIENAPDIVVVTLPDGTVNVVVLKLELSVSVVVPVGVKTSFQVIPEVLSVEEPTKIN